MLNSRIVRDQDARLQFEVMAWLIQSEGPPPRPPVPSPLHKTPGLESLAWTDEDPRSVFDWAEDQFGAIKSICQMDNWLVDLVPAGDGLDPEQVAASRRLNDLAAGRDPYAYQAEARPALYYDPRDCVEPGYFTARSVLKLAALRSAAFQSEYALTPLMSRMVVLTAAAYSRQGFVLANLSRDVAMGLTRKEDDRIVPQRLVVNALCFASCLGLRIRRQSEEQIIATYGTRMTKSFRKKVRQACRQVDSYEEDLAVLQMLANPRPQRAVTPYQILQRA